MNSLYRLGLVVGLLVVMLFPARAMAAACPSQPTAPDGSSITSPTPGAVVTSPLTIRGTHGRTFEANVPIRILDATGNVLVETFTTGVGEPPIVSFESTVTFNVSAPTPACIVVYRENVAEGGLIPLVQIPVTLSPVGMLPDTGAASLLQPLLGLALLLLGGGVLVRRRLQRI